MVGSLSAIRGRVRIVARRFAQIAAVRQPMLFPTYSSAIARHIESLQDDVRYAALGLAIQRLIDDGIEGAFAELGVYQGKTSAFIHHLAPERRLYLFDTFEGFPDRSLEGRRDGRFRDTSQEFVARTIGDTRNIEFRKGYFPETAAGIEYQHFAFVLLDFDHYRPALDALAFFYPRLVRRGFFFMHDFNSPESDRAISRAAREFLADKPELLIELPDRYGSAVFRKIS